MTLALTGQLAPLNVMIIVAIMGLIRPSDLGVRGALLADIMPAEQLIGAISLSRTTQDSARIAGALSGAGLFAVLGIGFVYVAIACLYFTSADPDAVPDPAGTNRIARSTTLRMACPGSTCCGT